MGILSWTATGRMVAAHPVTSPVARWALRAARWVVLPVALIVVSCVFPTGVSCVVTAAVAGGVAGGSARAVLGRLRAPVAVRAGPCEVVVAAGWALVVWRAAAGTLPPWWVPVPAALVWFTVVLTVSDLRHRLLPDRVTLPAYPVLAALLTLAALTGPGAGLAVRAAVAGAAVLAVHALIHLAAPAHLGAGDVKLAGPVGAVLGAVSWPAVLLGLVLAAVTTIALTAITRRHDAPHGPGLLVATLLAATFPATAALTS